MRASMCKRRAAYLLVGQDVAADLALAPLDELDVGLHALGGERLREEVADVRVRVQTSELARTSVLHNIVPRQTADSP